MRFGEGREWYFVQDVRREDCDTAPQPVVKVCIPDAHCTWLLTELDSNDTEDLLLDRKRDVVQINRRSFAVVFSEFEGNLNVSAGVGR